MNEEGECLPRGDDETREGSGNEKRGFCQDEVKQHSHFLSFLVRFFDDVAREVTWKGNKMQQWINGYK